MNTTIYCSNIYPVKIVVGFWKNVKVTQKNSNDRLYVFTRHSRSSEPNSLLSGQETRQRLDAKYLKEI